MREREREGEGGEGEGGEGEGGRGREGGREKRVLCVVCSCIFYSLRLQEQSLVMQLLPDRTLGL